MKTIKEPIYLVEVFNENENHWEWQAIRLQVNTTETEARKEAYMEFYGIDDDQEYVEKNYKENTRVFNINEIN